MDVSSLYTNIPHEEGVEWVSDFYEETLSDYVSTTLPPIDKLTIKSLMLFILRNCTFCFNDNFYTQLYGITMGAKFSVQFANIHAQMAFEVH